METATGTTAASTGSKFSSLIKSFRHCMHFLLTELSFEDFCKAFPSFNEAEQRQLFRLYAQVMAHLYQYNLDAFNTICEITKVETILDSVEDLVEQQRLDPLCSQKSNIGELSHELLTMKQNEARQLKEALDKVEDRKRNIKAQIDLLKNSHHQNSFVPTEAIEKFRLAMAKCGDYS